MNNYFLERQTFREFSDKDVSDGTIRMIAEAATHAPNTGNMQTYSLVITRDVAKLAHAHFNQKAATDAKVLLTFCADYNRFTKWCKMRSAEPYYGNFQSFVGAMIDASIFAQQFATIAEMEGLATCCLGTTTYNAPQIAETLNLPKLVVPVTTLALGWRRAGDKLQGTERLPIEAILHNEQYKDYSEEDINRFYKEKEALAENVQFVRENDKQTLAQVFTDVRYTKANNEYFSKVYRDFIESAGFTIAD